MLSAAAHTLLRTLLHDVPGRHHLLTLNTGHTVCTTVERRGRTFDVQRPEVVERLHLALLRGAPAGLVVRTLVDALPRPNGERRSPTRLVRGWRVDRSGLIPLDEAQMFDAHCTDAVSGEPVPPEPGVEYTGAPSVDLSPLLGR